MSSLDVMLLSFLALVIFAVWGNYRQQGSEDQKEIENKEELEVKEATGVIENSGGRTKD
jgi:hypothetical protein